MKFIGRRRQDALLLIVAALVVTLYVNVAGGGFALDDSWIHQTYGRNLAETGQWAFVPGVPSAASTSPLYTVLLAIGYKLGVNYMLWTYALGALTLAIAGMLGARMAARLMPKQNPIELVAGLSLVLAWHLIWAAASGMETMLFSLLTLALIWLAWRECSSRIGQATKRGVAFGALAALTTLARPEGIVLAGLVGVLMLVVRPQGSRRSMALWTIGAAVGFTVLIAPYLIYNLKITGGLLPDTAAAKQTEYALWLADSYPQRLVKMTKPLMAGGQFLLLPGAAYYAISVGRQLRRDNRHAPFFLLPLLWPAALIALYAARLPADYQHGRYVIPALPSLILAGVVGTAWLAWKGRATMLGRVTGRTLMISAALAYFYFAFGAGLMAYRQDVRIINEEMVASAHWIADNISPDDLLAVHDIGAVGYFAPRPILDLAGLVSPEVVPVILDEEALWDLMWQRGARYLMAFPDQVPGRDVSDSRLCPLFTTNGATSRSVSGPNMTIYALSWDGICS